MIQSQLIKKYKYISHGFFNRSGGFSKGNYKSLNCGIGSKDKKKLVYANLKKACEKIGCSKNNLILMKQIHSNKVNIINKILKKKIVGDSALTNKKKIALGILTADCAPVFIYDTNKKYIGAVHAGWKGAYKNIIKKTIIQFKNKGSKVKDLVAVIGPCILKKSYEVKNDFLQKFLKQNKNNISFFTFKKRKIFFSLNEFIFKQIKKEGINKIDIIKKDTYLDKNNFFSSRRSFDKKFDDYGRNISIIMIK
tara:strand:- start:677 stop:1429 length:753 start_codon:yes stop_codon:yes gene_type:complete